MKAHTWVRCDGVLSILSDQGAAANPLPQGEHSSAVSALPQLPFPAAWGYARLSSFPKELEISSGSVWFGKCPLERRRPFGAGSLKVVAKRRDRRQVRCGTQNQQGWGHEGPLRGALTMEERLSHSVPSYTVTPALTSGLLYCVYRKLKAWGKY